jgi:hypothetical protein
LNQAKFFAFQDHSYKLLRAPTKAARKTNNGSLDIYIFHIPHTFWQQDRKRHFYPLLAMTSTIMFLSRRYMKENERLRQELCRTHETNAKQITEKELIINELREQLNLIQSKPKFPPLMSPTSTIDLSSSTEGEYSLETGDLVHGSLLSIPSLPLQITEEEEEGLSDKLPTISRSISKITTSSIVRKLSKKKKHFFRKKARRRGTPLPTTHEQVEVDGEDGEKEQHMNHETTTTTTTSSGWSSEPLLPMSPIRSRPRRATIASGTSRVHQLPREQSLSNLSDDDDDTTATEGDESPVLSNTMQVQNRKVLDALEREGLFTGTIDRKTELPDAYGRYVRIAMAYRPKM